MNAPPRPPPIPPTTTPSEPAIAPLPSMSMRVLEGGVQEIALAPHTSFQNLGPPPAPASMLFRMAPFLLAITAVGVWVALGKLEAQIGWPMIMTAVLAAANASASGETAAAALVRSARRTFTRKDTPR